MLVPPDQPKACCETFSRAAAIALVRIRDVIRLSEVLKTNESTPPKFILQTEHELNQKAAIAFHRATDVTEQNDACLFKFSPARLKLDNIAAVFEIPSHGSAKIDLFGFTIGFSSAADARRNLTGENKNGTPDRNAILEFHLTKIFLTEDLDGAIRERSQRVWARRVIRGQHHTARTDGKSPPRLFGILWGLRW